MNKIWDMLDCTTANKVYVATNFVPNISEFIKKLNAKELITENSISIPYGLVPYST